MVRRLIVAAVCLACLGLALVFACPAGPAFFVAGGVGLGLMFAAVLLGLKAQRLAVAVLEDPEDKAFDRAVEAGHVNPGAVAMRTKGKRLIAEGRAEGDPEKIRRGEKMVNRSYSFLKGGNPREGVPD